MKMFPTMNQNGTPLWKILDPLLKMDDFVLEFTVILSIIEIMPFVSLVSAVGFFYSECPVGELLYEIGYIVVVSSPNGLHAGSVNLYMSMLLAG